MDPAAFVKRTAITLLFLFFLSTLSCSTKKPGQEKFGSDADYFIGLQMLKDGNEKGARTAFKRCVKKGSYYAAKKSAESLCSFGNLQERNLAGFQMSIRLNPKISG